jgi:hypothetical protein
MHLGRHESGRSDFVFAELSWLYLDSGSKVTQLHLQHSHVLVSDS